MPTAAPPTMTPAGTTIIRRGGGLAAHRVNAEGGTEPGTASVLREHASECLSAQRR